MFEDVSNVKISITKRSDSVVYLLQNDNDKKQEILLLCEKHKELIGDLTVAVISNVMHKTLTFRANSFIKLFKNYSDFRALRKTLDLSKLENEVDNQEIIYIYIRDPFEKK